jgi:hypothetical protein
VIHGLQLDFLLFVYIISEKQRFLKCAKRRGGFESIKVQGKGAMVKEGCFLPLKTLKALENQRNMAPQTG